LDVSYKGVNIRQGEKRVWGGKVHLETVHPLFEVRGLHGQAEASRGSILRVRQGGRERPNNPEKGMVRPQKVHPVDRGREEIEEQGGHCIRPDKVQSTRAFTVVTRPRDEARHGLKCEALGSHGCLKFCYMQGGGQATRRPSVRVEVEVPGNEHRHLIVNTKGEQGLKG